MFASLPGFRTETITAAFQIARSSALPTEKLKRLVRYATTQGPRCLRWIEVRPSGPVADELLAALIASRVLIGRKGAKFLSMGCFKRGVRRTLRVLGLWGRILVRKLQKFLAMSGALVKALPFKVFGWLGGGWVLLPERDFRRGQNLVVSAFCVQDSILSLHA